MLKFSKKYRFGSAGNLLLATLAGLAVASCGNGDKDDSATVVASEPEQPSFEDVKRESKEAAHTIAEYSENQRDEAIREIESALSATDQRLESFENRIEANWDELSDKARNEARESLETLKAKRAEVAESYNELKSDSGAAWEEVKRGFSEAYAELRAAFDDAEMELDKS